MKRHLTILLAVFAALGFAGALSANDCHLSPVDNCYGCCWDQFESCVDTATPMTIAKCYFDWGACDSGCVPDPGIIIGIDYDGAEDPVIEYDVAGLRGDRVWVAAGAGGIRLALDRSQGATPSPASTMFDDCHLLPVVDCSGCCQDKFEQCIGTGILTKLERCLYLWGSCDAACVANPI